MSTCKYLGGHPAHPQASKLNVNVILDDAGVHAAVLRELFVVPWSEVVGLSAEGPEQVGRRVTATRLLTLGVFAFAAKKQQKLAYLTVTMRGGGEVLFEVAKTTPQELRGKIAPMLGLFTAARPVATQAAPLDQLDRLAKASELHLAGVLNDEEFAAQKARILADG